ncbi:LysR family transcriptional regulator [Saccharopolyspora shandongensis]|uniref:LysR family transcriptional regulator n=1 Tax=Saccharopolyspora shandongensis TaxID=418495 RepID=UPI0033D55684
MEIRQLQYFVAVAKEGGFGRAAERLNIVQPAVSQLVRRLERELGVQLFDRSTRQIRITSAGERLLPEAKAVLAAASRVLAVAGEIKIGTEGVLRLGTGRAPDPRVDAAVDDLVVAAPRLRVRIVKSGLADRLVAVRSGELDAALVRAMSSAAGLELVPLWTDPVYAVVPARHPLADEDVLRLEQLAELPLRLAPRDANPPFHDLITAALRDAGVEPPVGPPFTHLQGTFADIATDPTASWTAFYRAGDLPPARHVAIRPLAGVEITTSLVVPPGPAGPALRLLLDGFRRITFPGADRAGRRSAAPSRSAGPSRR